MTDSAPAEGRMHAFTFGEPEAVLDRRELLDYAECWRNGRWYEPPISLDGLARVFGAAVHHASAIHFKVNILTGTYVPHPMLSRATFERVALDFEVFGNGYLERRESMGRTPLQLAPAPALYTRRGVVDGEFFCVRGYRTEHEFRPGTVLQVMQPDVRQEIYGVPQYMSAVQSTLLNESATLFRRRYYLNGSHAGFILYISDENVNEDDVDQLRAALKASKGPGNFRNLFLHSPNGKKDGVQLIPISEVAARDEFIGIKEATRDDQLAAHRVPPQLMGVVPRNSAGFGSIRDAAGVFALNELQPLQVRIATAINDWIGDEVVTFAPYALASPAPAAA